MPGLESAQQELAAVVAALGGQDRVRAVTTLRTEGEGTLLDLGQDLTPYSTSNTFTLDFLQLVDMAEQRMRIEQTRTPDFVFWLGQDPQPRQVFGLDGTMGYDVAPNGEASRSSNAEARDRRAAFYHHPLTIIRAALDSSSTVTRGPNAGDTLTVTTADGLDFTIAIDPVSRLPRSVASASGHPYLGDVTTETSFGDYREVGGIKLPTRLTTSIRNYPTVPIRDIWVTTQAVDEDLGDLAAPVAAASAEPNTGPSVTHVVANEVSRGIWHLTGTFNHSILVEFSDHTMLFNAPDEARTLALIAKAREIVPRKPVTQMVSMHHHFDHSGGLRAAVSEGLTIVAQAGNAGFYEEIIERPRTIDPDALTRNPRPLVLESIDDERTFGDDAMTVVLYRITGNQHADNYLMAYLPRQQLLIESDAWSPGNAVSPFAGNLVENIERRNLRVDTVLPTHQTVASYQELVDFVRSG